jgi:alkylglycerol monooxygenase
MPFSVDKAILFATPVFFTLMALELAYGWLTRRNNYRTNDAVNSISLGVYSQLTGVFTRFFRITIYTFLYHHIALFQLPADSWVVWVGALVLYDFCYYWYHRLSHTINAFWGAHVVHHSSEEFNLSTALRQPSMGFVFNWVFYLPLALLGVPPPVFAMVAFIDLVYQYWVHTEHIKTMGWFDRVFVSPMNHRVHHAVNDPYLDKNFGGILILWDRMFGTFQPELAGEKCVYGTRAPLHSWNPLWANFQVYTGLVKDSWRASNWKDKFKVWSSAPGWRPADVAAADPKPAFDIANITRYNPPMRLGLKLYCLLQFGIVLALTTQFLSHAKAMALGPKLGFFVLLVVHLITLGGLMMQQRAYVWVEAVRALTVAFGAFIVGQWFTGAVIRPPLGLPIIALTVVSLVWLFAVTYAPERRVVQPA